MRPGDHIRHTNCRNRRILPDQISPPRTIIQRYRPASSNRAHTRSPEPRPCGPTQPYRTTSPGPPRSRPNLPTTGHHNYGATDPDNLNPCNTSEGGTNAAHTSEGANIGPTDTSPCSTSEAGGPNHDHTPHP